MNIIDNIMLKSKKFNKYLQDVKENKFPMSLSGLTDVAKVHMAYATALNVNKPFVIITYNEIQAKKLLKDLKYFKDNILYFPKKEIVTYDIEAESRDIQNQRASVLNNIAMGKNPIIVTTIETLMQKIISKAEYEKDILEIDISKEYKLDNLKKTLVNLGYERCELVEGKGQFSIRGGIVDISPTYTDKGIRIELWGDSVDSIRLFDISTQRSIKNIDEITIYPATEFLLTQDIDSICENILDKKYTNKVKEIIDADIESIREGNYQSKMQKYFEAFYPVSDTILDYLSDDYLIFIDEASRIKQRNENIISENENVIELLTEKQKVIPHGYINVLDYIEYLQKIENKNLIYLERLDNKFVDKQNMHAKRNGYSFTCREVNFFRGGMDLFIQEVKETEKSNKFIIILRWQ